MHHFEEQDVHQTTKTVRVYMRGHVHSGKHAFAHGCVHASSSVQGIDNPNVFKSTHGQARHSTKVRDPMPGGKKHARQGKVF
jgi:hypothetical protein